MIKAGMGRMRAVLQGRWRGAGLGVRWRLVVLCALVLWLFMPPPRDSFAACAPWPGGPCIDARPTPGSGDRPSGRRDDGEPSSGRGSGPGCASVPTRPSADESEPVPAAGSPHAELAHVVWSEGGRFKPAEGYRWSRPDDPDDFSVEPWPEGTPHPTLPHVVWSGDGQFHPALGYRWIRPDDLNDFRVEPWPEGTPHPTLPHVVWSGDGQQFHPAPGYLWRDQGNSTDFRVVPWVAVDRWRGGWRGDEQNAAVAALGAMQDATLRNWLAAHAEFGRFPDDRVSPLSVSGAMLRFKDLYFDSAIPAAQRENLLAFEGGKAFYDMVKDVRLEDGNTFERWFLGFYPAHSDTVSEMSVARHQGQPLGTSDLVDTYSAFGHLFRAQVLDLEQPDGADSQRDWNEVRQSFKEHLDQVLRGR